MYEVACAIIKPNWGTAFALCVALLAPKEGAARVYDLYRADYVKGAFCSAIAGACAADEDVENAYFQNPAALSAGESGINFDGDYNGSSNLEPGMKGSNDVSEVQFMAGFGWNFARWGAAISVAGRKDHVISNVSLIDEQGFTRKFPLTTDSTELQVRLPFSYQVDPKTSLGIALSVESVSQTIQGSQGTRAAISQVGFPIRLGLTFGGILRPSKKLRLGSWLRSPTSNYAKIDFAAQAYSNQLNYHEDVAYHQPWIWAWGGQWNPWSDRRAFLLDLDFVGPTSEGFLLTYDSFSTALGDARIRAKGRSVVVEPRLGYRGPWYPGSRGTLMLGGYFESSRWEGLRGRGHLTGGVSYPVSTWFELMAGGDIAKDFAQVFLTFR